MAAARRSGALHRPWVHPPSTAAQFRDYLKRLDNRVHWSFLVCERETGSLAGVITVSNAIRGPLQSAFVGYYAFAGFERRGYMRAALKAVVRYAFGTLKLHRLEINVQAENAASIALARSCGFLKEGYSPRYLKIGGRWRDHERWAMVAR